MKNLKSLLLILTILLSLPLSQLQAQTPATDTWAPAKYNTGLSTWRLGNVGIGTSSPAADIHIYKGLSVEGGELGASNAAPASILLQSAGSISQGGPIGLASWYINGSSSSLQLSSGFMTGFTMLGDGKVGIGTTAPFAQLHVGGNLRIDQVPEDVTQENVLLVNEDGDVKYRHLPTNVWDGDDDTDNQDLSVTGNTLNISGGNGVDLDLLNRRWVGPNNSDDPIHRLGPVSIGTATPPVDGYQLAVVGGIITEEVKVKLCDGQWCDYVFEADYDLKPLEEVADFIAQNGHLHNTPSAKTVEADGLEIKSMTINQQEKIEELFLHIIELNERMKHLEKENEILKTSAAPRSN